MADQTYGDVLEKMRRRAHQIAVHDGEKWLCRVCKAIVQQTTGYASVHDGPFPLSGSGEVRQYAYPYCPKCEGRPAHAPREFIRG